MATRRASRRSTLQLDTAPVIEESCVAKGDPAVVTPTSGSSIQNTSAVARVNIFDALYKSLKRKVGENVELLKHLEENYTDDTTIQNAIFEGGELAGGISGYPLRIELFLAIMCGFFAGSNDNRNEFYENLTRAWGNIVKKDLKKVVNDVGSKYVRGQVSGTNRESNVVELIHALDCKLTIAGALKLKNVLESYPKNSLIEDLTGNKKQKLKQWEVETKLFILLLCSILYEPGKASAWDIIGNATGVTGRTIQLFCNNETTFDLPATLLDTYRGYRPEGNKDQSIPLVSPTPNDMPSHCSEIIDGSNDGIQFDSTYHGCDLHGVTEDEAEKEKWSGS